MERTREESDPANVEARATIGFKEVNGTLKGDGDMLVLSRKLGERICIGNNIYITVVDINRGKIRLGIEAPRDVPVYRQELLADSDQPAEPNVVLTR
jgi:carbon storage regulator